MEIFNMYYQIFLIYENFFKVYLNNFIDFEFLLKNFNYSDIYYLIYNFLNFGNFFVWAIYNDCFNYFKE